MTESGYPMDLRGWWAGLVPAGTPKPVVDQLGVWISQIVSSDEGKKFLANIASDAWVSKPDEAQALFPRTDQAVGRLCPYCQNRTARLTAAESQKGNKKGGNEWCR